MVQVLRAADYSAKSSALGDHGRILPVWTVRRTTHETLLFDPPGPKGGGSPRRAHPRELPGPGRRCQDPRSGCARWDRTPSRLKAGSPGSRSSPPRTWRQSKAHQSSRAKPFGGHSSSALGDSAGPRAGDEALSSGGSSGHFEVSELRSALVAAIPAAKRALNLLSLRSAAMRAVARSSP